MNKQAELTRWTPKRLLSLLMALIMTLSLLPTAALANDETQTLHLNNFKTASGSGESESVVDVAFGNIGTNGTSYRLSVHIDPKPDYAPGQKVDVRATADLLLEGGDQVDESHPLKVTVGNTAVTSEPNSSTSDSTSRTATDNSCTIGLDGSISFTTSIEYSVITSGSSEAITGSKTVPVKIEGLWTGYNVTFTTTEGLGGVTFTGGIPADGKAKTYARNAEAGDFTPVYKLLASMGATKDGYTFEGWTFKLKAANGNIIGGQLAAGTECEYNFGGDGTFTADLAKNQEITFDPGDYSGVTGLLNKAQYSQGTKYTITVQDPKLDGYQFAGWLVEGSSIAHNYKMGETVYGITGATTLIAQWTPDDGSAPAGSHKVTFYENGSGVYNMPASQTVKHDSTATEPTVKPQRDGYTFGGWYKEPTCTTKWNFTTDTVTDDLELYAKWTATPVMVQITNLGAADGVKVINLTPNSSIGSEAHFTVQVPDKYNTSDLLVYAGDPQASYRMLAPVERVELKNTTTGVVESVMLYYQFTVTEDLIDVGTTGALTLPVAVGAVTAKTFNVTLPTGAGFDAAFTNTSIVDKFTTVDYDGNVSFTVKARPGYTVEGVYANGEKLTPNAGTYTIEHIKANQAVMVDMAAIQFHTVTYVLDGAQMATQSVANGSKATSLSAPDKTGYNWDSKWYKDERYTSEFDFATEKITKDTILYGRYTPDKVTISYDVLPGETTAKTYGLAATLTETIPVKDGHTFLGWSESDTATAASYLPGATFSKEIDHNITLYAVWQQKTYTITFSSGEGYSLHNGHASMTVAHGANFDFNLIVDRDYAENEPKVWKNTDGVNSGKPLSNGTPTINQDGSKKYHYTLTNVTENIAINVDVRSNTIYTVTFMTNGSIYQTQQVGYNEKATRPVDPVVEGYKFEGWYKEADYTTPWYFVDTLKEGSTTEYYPANTVKENTAIYAKLTPIEPVITWKTPTATDGYTIAVEYTAPGTTDAIALTTPRAVPYKSVVTFTITINDGYDASKMQVGVNGVLLAPKDKSTNGKTYTFEFIAKQDTEAISVTGIERKTVTIIYNDNGGYGGPVQETVNYYLPSGPNDKISTTVPTREGYDFLGWAKTNGADAPAYSNPAKTDPVTTNVADFISDTVLYAVWQAKKTGIELKVDKTEQYEGEDVTLTATITSAGSGASVTTGSVQFYRCTDADPTATTATWTLLNSAVVSGGTAIYTAKTSDFVYGGTNTDTYKAVFIPTEGNGYTEITSDTKAVTVKSTAISWKLDAAPKIDADANVLTIKDKNDHTVTAMVAGQVYTLELPAIYALDDLGTQLTVNKDYSVTWQYRDANGIWTDYTNSGSGDTTKVDAAYSQYVFRAVVKPVTGATSHFTKAAKYGTGNALEKDQYETVLISEPTTAVDLQKTTTELEITGADNEGSVTIAGTSVTTGLAQFEGQKVTLTATVKDKTTNAGVKSGEVKFFRYVDGTSDELLNTTLISVDSNGVATCGVEISKWTDGKSVTENKDEFYAVYQPNATYDTSASWTTAAGELKAVYIKSTAIKTPIIDSTLEGEGGKKATTYGENLTGLLAGVEHTFRLRTGNAEADWSVVALDGRTVEAKNYTIQWITKTGNNAETTAATGSEFKTSDNKVRDEIYVRLNPTGDMKTGADSKKAIIGTKQGVKVTVEAIDAIDKTPTAKDVYQLNEIELRATVTAADAKASMQPDGLVQFYYVDDNNFVEIGKPVSIQTVGGARYASIKTNQLPVTAVDNTKRDVKITAVYLGDTTFKASDNCQLKSGSTTEWEVTAADIPDTVKSDTVTVYSSVVYAGASENKATTTPSTDGITITANGVLKANESSVTLTLGQVYTLDHPIDLSKLTYNTDYTVQWQILKNALQHQDSSAGSYATTDKWEDLPNQTGSSYTGTMEQDAAYRAKITVKDTPIAKGSFTKVDQLIKGRDVYYSNVLVVGAGMATVTTSITTSANQKFNEEGIVSGETATIHVLASGAAKTTPISTVTATITKSGATEPVFNEKANNVNGYTSFAWDTSDLTPGYYTLTVTAESNNGYAPQTITRTLIVRDNAYTLSATTISKVYNGKAQGIDWELTGVDIENALAQKSVVVYYTKDGKMVEPTQAGEYQYDLYLPASAYWTELTHVSGTFIIEKRKVSVDDLVAQAKVYDGTNNANIQEIILNDSAVDSKGTATGNTGIIDGDSVYAVGTGYTSKDTASTDATLGVKGVSLEGDDAANYEFKESDYTEVFNIQRSQVKGAIVSGRTYKYTGKDIKLAASDIYLIDQAGNQLTDYDVTYYYHNGDGVEKVDAMNKMGKYTVIARPEQDNYKGGATAIVYVGNTDTPGTLDNSAKSSLITISNTVELYGAAENKGIVATATKGTATAYYYYNNGTSTDWHTDVPANAGRYLVKATVTNDGVTDTAYGIYTVVKARPALTLTATNATYNSAQYNGAPTGNYNGGALPADTYYTYTGGTIQGVAYEAPTEAGDYVVTAHVGKAANYTAHEISANFTIDKAPLTIKADDLQRWQYGSFPDMVASYQGLTTGGVAADTSLRDVQIQPEFLFNEKDGGYSNHAFDQVGTYPVTVRNALARNYTVTYESGTIATTEEEPKAELAIHGMPDNGTTTENLVYYGDTIQLYAYGYYKTLDSSRGSYNTSSLIEWSVSDASIAKIDQSGLLTIKGVGAFKVTLKRGSGSAAISTDIDVTAEKQEVKVVVPAEDKVYDGTTQDYTSTKTLSAVNAMGTNVFSRNDRFVIINNTRSDVGSQIVTGKVSDSIHSFQSETYGGLFTINVKDVTVKPKEISVIYGDALGTLGYTDPNIIAGIPALTDGKAVSEREDYKNLDVLNGYEILVAGKENENYNVKYVTDQDAPDVEVTAKALTISTGTLKDQIGMTSGSLNPNGEYPVNGAAIDDPAPAMRPSNVRMYGEPNWVMDKDPVTLISGDTLANLTALNGQLVSFDYNIGADANITYLTRNDAAPAAVDGRAKYDVVTNATMMAFKNYTVTYTLGTQNIYQRPVTLSVPSGMTLTAYKPSILDSSNQVKNNVLLNLLLNNLIVSKYNNEGGLAELLKHTIKDLGIQIKSTQVTGDKLTVKIALGNQNYWLNSANEQTFEITLVTEKIVPKYSTLDWTSFSVTMYDAEGKAPVSVNGAVNFYIFKKKDGADLKYSDYKNDPIIRSGPMTPTGSTGQYVASFERLPAGEYAYFAIAQNYTIVE